MLMEWGTIRVFKCLFVVWATRFDQLMAISDALRRGRQGDAYKQLARNEWSVTESLRREEDPPQACEPLSTF